MSEHSEQNSTRTSFQRVAMAAGIDAVVAQRCSVLVPVADAWGETTLLYTTELILTRSDLAFTIDSPDGWMERRILLEDLVGIRVRAQSESTGSSCAVDVHSLPLVRTASWFSANETQSRKHEVDQVLFDSGKTFEQNVKFALAWKRTVMQYCEKAVEAAFGASKCMQIL